jgi:hypothetical protein
MIHASNAIVFDRASSDVVFDPRIEVINDHPSYQFNSEI